jgi:hypothetical protein
MAGTTIVLTAEVMVACSASSSASSSDLAMAGTTVVVTVELTVAYLASSSASAMARMTVVLMA